MTASKCTLILDTTTFGGLEQTLDDAYDAGFDYLSFPLIPPQDDNQQMIENKNAANSKSLLSNIPFAYFGDIDSRVLHCCYGKCSQWIRFDHENEQLCSASEQLLLHELKWAKHLTIFYVILPPPTITILSNSNSNHPSDINEEKEESLILDKIECPTKYASAMIRVFLNSENTIGVIPIPSTKNGYQLWKQLSILMGSLTSLRVGLIVDADVSDNELHNQWFAEGVRTLILNTSIFLTNTKGYPVLSRKHQLFIDKFLHHSDLWIILQGDTDHKPKLYSQYLKYIQKNSAKQRNLELDRIEKPFWDAVQIPLQPLFHNLDYATYEVFESDPVKYVKYEEAIALCLRDWNMKLNLSNADQNTNNADDDEEAIVLMVLGAGRGPLVDSAITASLNTGINIKIYAIEKNPHAVIILQKKQEFVWTNNHVIVVDTDMRTWDFPEKAHIIVSELLGSFGDNELSPECLDGGQRMLRDDGVCIPSSYTSYLCPISNFNIYQTLIHRPKEFETPYVINLKRFQFLSSVVKSDEMNGIQKCWSFAHPLKANEMCNNNTHNQRYCKLTFNVDVQQSILHGFVGYFDTVLYKNVCLSIHPCNFSKGMFSWFPIFFPLLNPISVVRNDKITVHFWRKVDKSCIWYEWCLSEPNLSVIHNPNHRSYEVRL